MKNWEDTRTTPEEIVDRLGNIANRSDINDTKRLQVKEIREYAANQLEHMANGLVDIKNLDDNDQVFNYTVGMIAQSLIARAQAIREGQ